MLYDITFSCEYLIHWSQLKALTSVCVSMCVCKLVIRGASVVALTAFVRHPPHVRPHLYLKTWCVYAREALVTFVCLLTSMCHLVFLQLMYVLVCKSYHIGQTLSNTFTKAYRQCASFCQFAMHQRKLKWNCTVCSYVAVLLRPTCFHIMCFLRLLDF